MSPSLSLVAWRTGILISIYRIVVGIKRKSAHVVPGTGEVLNKLVPFIPPSLSFGCLEKSPSCPPKDITHVYYFSSKTNTQIVQQRPILHHGNLLFLIIRLYPVTAVGHLA